MKEISFKFYHGLGDAANCARLIQVYRNHGFEVSIETSDDKKCIFEAAGAKIIESSPRENGWWIPSDAMDLKPGSVHGWMGNKPGVNMRHFGLADTASMDVLWNEYKNSTLKFPIGEEEIRQISDKIDNWKRPIILWHSIGNTSQELKSFRPDEQQNFAYHLLDITDGTVVILDWDSRATWTEHNRLKHSGRDLENPNLKQLAALISRSDLLIGIDSGPLYFASLLGIPAVGIYFGSLHPAEYMVPWPEALSITTGDRSKKIDPSKRFEFQLIDLQNNMGTFAEWSLKMLKPRQYLQPPLSIASDVQLQHIIQQKCRGHGHAGCISSIYDRNHSFHILLKECGRLLGRNPYPLLPTETYKGLNFVETGCIRSDEDWGGAGFSTALFGRYCQLTNSNLTSFDLDPNNVRYAQEWCRQFGEAVKIECCRGEDGIRNYIGPIDVLYLDSLDTGADGYQECNLREFQAAELRLHQDSIVLIDDTPSLSSGKGALTIPYALSKRWKVSYAGYQVLLTR